ncbi:hypothetical protein EV122DRAFT_285566 [Schizophyllum commune]
MSSGHHRLGHERYRLVYSSPPIIAFAFKHGPSLRFKRTLAHVLKRAFVLAFEFAFTLKLIPFFFKSNLSLKLLLVLKRALSRTTPTR